MKKIISLLFFITLISLLLHPLVSADQNVSATIPPRVSDFQFALNSNNAETLQQGKTITYQISYGAKQSAGVNTIPTIIVDFGKATAPNNAHILEYVNGSASTAYGGTVPVVDVLNRTVTWTIPSLPQGTTDQNITFQLRTTSDYTGSDSVDFTLHAGMNNQYITMPDQSITQTYQYHASSLSPTATPKPQPSVAITPSPTPTPTLLPLYSIDFSGISDKDTTLRVNSNTQSKLTILYGTSPQHLTQKIATESYQQANVLTIQGLNPDTIYFFKILSTELSGQTTTSELYTFRTAKRSTQPILDNNIIVVSSNGNVFLSNTQKQDTSAHPSVTLTINSDYDIAYSLNKPTALHAIEAVVINKLLGANTLAAIDGPSEIIIPMQQKTQTLYVANLKTPASGLYEVYVRITDMHGNIIQKKITDLKVMPRFTVFARDTNLPLADARVYLSYFDTLTKTYQPLSTQLFGTIANPSYTNAQGQIQITLPAGRYRAQESALFYDKATVDFTIGSGVNQNFPIIYLQKDPFNLSSLYIIAKDYLSDTWTKTSSILRTFSSSIRLFNLFAAAVLGSFVIINFLLFTLKAHIKPHHLPIFFLFHLDRLFNRHKQKYIYGTILDEKNRPLSHVLIEIEDADTKNILLQTSTNKAGKFYCSNVAGAVNVIVTKEGFAPTIIAVENESMIPHTGLQINLAKGVHHHRSLFSLFLLGFGDMLGLLFEVSLVITIILEALFFTIYGLEKTAPYLLFSLINIILWLFYVHEHSKKMQI